MQHRTREIFVGLFHSKAYGNKKHISTNFGLVHSDCHHFLTLDSSIKGDPISMLDDSTD